MKLLKTKNLLLLILPITLLSSCYPGGVALNRAGSNNIYCQRVEKYLNLLAQPGLTPEEKARYRRELHDNTKYCDDFGKEKEDNSSQKDYIQKSQNSKPKFNPYKPKVF